MMPGSIRRTWSLPRYGVSLRTMGSVRSSTSQGHSIRWHQLSDKTFADTSASHGIFTLCHIAARDVTCSWSSRSLKEGLETRKLDGQACCTIFASKFVGVYSSCRTSRFQAFRSSSNGVTFFPSNQIFHFILFSSAGRTLLILLVINNHIHPLSQCSSQHSSLCLQQRPQSTPPLFKTDKMPTDQSQPVHAVLPTRV